MKIAILGYGQMGHIVEKEILSNNFEVSTIIDNEQDWISNIEAFRKSDVAIEFSTPATAIANMKRAIENNVPIVVGTTGWNAHEAEMREFCIKNNGKVVFGSNFSIGVNIFFEINKILAKILNSQPQYKVSVEEIHHTRKKDAPSGTAIHIANDIIDEHERYESWKLSSAENSDKIIDIKAVREGDVPGTHIVNWGCEADELEIRHTAHGREGFAKGAVFAAKWIVKQESGFYEFNKTLNFNNL